GRHTRFSRDWSSDVCSSDLSTSGEYSGVGIEVTLDKGVVRVVTPIEGTPAERAGVKAGDTIVSIDGVAVDPEQLEDTIDRMRGADRKTSCRERVKGAAAAGR